MGLYRRAAVAVISALLLILVALPAVGLAATSPTLLTKRTCTNGVAVTTLSVLNDNGKHEVEFSMDKAVPGSEWAVVLKHNGVRFWHIHKFARTDGSWTVRQLTTDLAGPDTFYAKATNTLNGQFCSARVRH
jgi:hypothetical protein